jgi:hypothetical protein
MRRKPPALGAIGRSWPDCSTRYASRTWSWFTALTGWPARPGAGGAQARDDGLHRSRRTGGIRFRLAHGVNTLLDYGCRCDWLVTGPRAPARSGSTSLGEAMVASSSRSNCFSTARARLARLFTVSTSQPQIAAIFGSPAARPLARRLSPRRTLPQLSLGDRAQSRPAKQFGPTVRRSAAALPRPSLAKLVLQIGGNLPAAISFMRLKFVASN